MFKHRSLSGTFFIQLTPPTSVCLTFGLASTQSFLTLIVGVGWMWEASLSFLHVFSLAGASAYDSLAV